METTKPKPFVFVLMPFDKQFRDIYEVGIKAACKEAGAYCERVDEQIFQESILERIYNQIAKADIIVSEMTGRNPNVFYETGYAHALNKQVILLTKNSEDIPFDLKHYPHIVYGESISELKNQLQRKIVWSLENPKESTSAIDRHPKIYINRIDLDTNPTITLDLRSRNESPNRYYLSINIHNTNNKKLSPDNYLLSVITPNELSVNQSLHDQPPVILGNGEQIQNLDSPIIFPDAWRAIDVSIYSYIKDTAVNITVRIIGETGTKDYPFKLICKS